MKIILTGGGTGGHFYPLIAVVRAIKKRAEEENIAKLEFFFMDDFVVDKEVLFTENIKFIKIPAGKMRRYFSLRYLPDTIKMLAGLFWAFWRLYLLLPDIIFSKGGYSSLPVLFWARLFKIPVLAHESDAVPGIVNQWAGVWVSRMALSFHESAKFFEGRNVSVTGHPVRNQVLGGNIKEASEYFNLDNTVPTVLILGGSQGSEKINEIVLAILNQIVSKYHIIHQTGNNHFNDVSGRSNVALGKNDYRNRYHPYPFLAEGELRNAAKASSLVVSRGGAGAIFEIAAWGLPAILIPLPNAAQDHQRENAYAYARATGCVVMEEANLTPHLLLAEIDKLLFDRDRVEKMRKGAENFARIDAADKIAEEIIKLGIHE